MYVRLFNNHMPTLGKLIALEGIDGSGKRTQLEMLAHALTARGIPHVTVSFPHYEGFFGRMVANYLNGEFGGLARVDVRFSALLFAGDRLENRSRIEEELKRGRFILADRYVGSNLAHQGARVSPRQLGSFLAWLKQLEYDVYGLPREDLVILLRLPAPRAQRLISKKPVRRYTHRRRDLQEASLSHLKAAAHIYDRLAREPNWVTVDCEDSRKGILQPPKAIHLQVMSAVESRLLRLAAAG